MTDKYITVRKHASVGTVLQLNQIINAWRYVQSDDDTNKPKIRSVDIDCVNSDQIKKN